MSNDTAIEAATMCFACGPDNPIGLKIRFALNDGICTGEFTANENHVGYENTVHGGIIFSALDDVMANVLYLQNIKAHTARCEVRYRQALQVGEPVLLRGWIENERKRLIVLKGEVRLASDNSVVADCEASFMRV
ncbi:MAG: PaaI family thioesterase [Woeseiaceae bacterium]|nr:PaaI family thioesterase [Woeseiaceae bacterium]